LKKAGGIPYVHHNLIVVQHRWLSIKTAGRKWEKWTEMAENGWVFRPLGSVRIPQKQLFESAGWACGQSGRNGKKRWLACNEPLPRRLAVGVSPGSFAQFPAFPAPPVG
jgi:hypothetical protein